MRWIERKPRNLLGPKGAVVAAEKLSAPEAETVDERRISSIRLVLFPDAENSVKHAQERHND